MFIDLVHNVALLLALGLLYDIIVLKPQRAKPSLQQLLIGVAIGAIGIAVMLSPWEFRPGIIFDARSILLGIAGLFFGTVPTLIAVLMTAGLRLYQGGDGVWMGGAVIVTSGGIGLAWRHLRHNRLEDISMPELYLFGIVVHLAMLLEIILLPWSVAFEVLSKISLPVILLYPIGTVFLGKLMAGRLVRHRAEKKLRESEENLRITLDSIGDAVISTDTDGRIVLFNPVAQKLTGFSLQEAVGRAVYEVFNIVKGQTNEPAENPVKRVLEEGKVVGLANHTVCISKDGSAYQIADSGAPIRNSEGEITGVVLVFRDVTETYRQQEALRESEKKYRQLFENMSSGVAIYGAVDDGEDFVFVDFNEAAEAIEDINKENVIGKRVTEVFPGVEELGLFDVFKEVWRTGETQYHPAAMYEDERRVGWRENWVCKFPSGEIVAIYNDITEQKQAKEKLKESEGKYRVLFEKEENAMFIFELDTFIIIDANPAMTKTYGYSYDELIGMNCLNFSAEREKSKTAAAEADKKGKVDIKLRWHKKKDGTVFPLELQVYKTELEGRTVGYAVIRDITERKQAEAEREKLQTQLNQAQKMESVGRLAGGVAHDFNNMLGIILGYTDMILEGMDPDQPFHADLTEIKKAGERSADLTRQLLAFARKQTVAPKVLDLNQSVEDMLKMLHRLIGEDIDMAWIPGEAVWPVKIDPAQIDQILANLCVNARDAIADVGKVTIETGNMVFDEDYCKEHAGFVPGEYALLAVSDNGCGMDAKLLETIFEPFFTTKELNQGSGLGLATVYGAVKQNNGFINVYSEPGKGTTFKIYLPHHAARATETKEPKTQAAERGSETILLVEDEPAILGMTTIMLERTGYKVLAAATPGEAFALAREHLSACGDVQADVGEIHLLMTDVVMPEMNGRDLAKNLLSLYPNLKRLFMSGYTANVIAHHGVLDEDVHFIQKPFSIEDLAVKVREALED